MPNITDEHKAFACALVTLARMHGANNLSVTYDFSSAKKFLAGEDGTRRQKMIVRWAEGRHGAPERINIEANEQVHLHETIESN
jgi:hypothetical protein